MKILIFYKNYFFFINIFKIIIFFETKIRLKQFFYYFHPQNDFAPVTASNTPSLDNPKSVNKTCPSLSKTIFSGLRSLKMISFLCSSSKAKMISHKYILTLSSENLVFIKKKKKILIKFSSI